jgi:broad specificity phosphatase PhoE
VFTSGGPTAVALRQTLATSREQTIRLSWELRNTSITVLRYEQQRLWLVLFNCAAHLETINDPALITYI